MSREPKRMGKTTESRAYTYIIKRQTFFGPIMRKEAMENIVMTRKINSRRGRCRPKEIVLVG